MRGTTRIAALMGVVLVVGVVGTTGTHATRTPDGARTVVVAELFTSEGCSSCPPADDLLRRFIATQPVEGVEIVALGNHVDYWDRLGWRDPFSSPVFSQRQSSYDAAVFRSNGIYTPQLVVDGTLECVGSDDGAVRRTILRAARAPKGMVSVSAISTNDARVRVEVNVQLPATVKRHGPADIVVAVTENGLVSRVQRGENGGRTLSHHAVVRLLTTAGQIGTDENTLSASTVVPLASDWKTANLHFVAFLQEQTSRRILGGGASLLPSPRSEP